MKVIAFLIIASFIIALIFLYAFFWAIKSGQYEDDYAPSVRILMEDKKADEEVEEEKPGNDTSE